MKIANKTSTRQNNTNTETFRSIVEKKLIAIELVNNSNFRVAISKNNNKIRYYYKWMINRIRMSS